MKKRKAELNITIIVPVFNGLEHTKKSMHSLFHLCRIEDLNSRFNVVVVDDGSQDNSYEWIRENYPQVLLLQGTGDLWWSGSINAGVEYALGDLNSDYIVWWNNDILPDEQYFRKLESILNNIPDKTIVGSKIFMDEKRSIIWSMGGIFNPRTGRKYMTASGFADNGKYSEPVQADWLPGMGTITPRSVYDKIGLLDQGRFPQYHGDSDFTLRAGSAGYSIKVFPELVIYNDTSHSGIRHNESFNRLILSMTSIKSNYNIKKDLLFYRKHVTSAYAYTTLIEKYFRYIGGFIKWKVLRVFGVNR